MISITFSTRNMKVLVDTLKSLTSDNTQINELKYFLRVNVKASFIMLKHVETDMEVGIMQHGNNSIFAMVGSIPIEPNKGTYGSLKSIGELFVDGFTWNKEDNSLGVLSGRLILGLEDAIDVILDNDSYYGNGNTYIYGTAYQHEPYYASRVHYGGPRDTTEEIIEKTGVSTRISSPVDYVVARPYIDLGVEIVRDDLSARLVDSWPLLFDNLIKAGRLTGKGKMPIFSAKVKYGELYYKYITKIGLGSGNKVIGGVTVTKRPGSFESLEKYYERWVTYSVDDIEEIVSYQTIKDEMIKTKEDHFRVTKERVEEAKKNPIINKKDLNRIRSKYYRERKFGKIPNNMKFDEYLEIKGYVDYTPKYTKEDLKKARQRAIETKKEKEKKRKREEYYTLHGYYPGEEPWD